MHVQKRQPELESLWQKWQSELQLDRIEQQDAQAHAQLQRLFMASDFARQQWMKGESSVLRWQQLHQMALSAEHPEPWQWLDLDEHDLMARLRLWRNECMLAILLRDLNGQPTDRTCQQLSWLADSAVAVADAYSFQQMSARYGLPGICPHSGDTQRLMVLSMGKHGASELNFSSDIDLIFAYSCQGMTLNPAGETISHEEFFTFQGRLLIRLLDQLTAQGFVFRVDMRLRPWGQSGPLVCSQPFLEDYYQSQGREWERFAMIKVRSVTGHPTARAVLETSLKQFCFRPYVDFRVMDSLRGLKQMIAKEVRRRGNQHNIKLGQGGIREVEFIVQAIQLIRGGQDKALQQANLFALAPILRQEYLPATVVDELLADYCCLRDTEHLLQGFADKQTQDLPSSGLPAERMAWAAGFDSLAAWLTHIADARARINGHFENFIALDDQAQLPEKASQLQAAWPEPSEALLAAFIDDQQQVLQVAQLVTDFATSSDVGRMSDSSRKLLDQLMPLMLHELVQLQQPALAWQRVRPVVEAILRRSVYIALLLENPQAIRQLLKLVLLSPWVSEHLAQTPFLLDELTDPASLYNLPRRHELVDELRQLMVRLPEDDMEQHMEVLRQFKRSRQLRAAACELTGALPLMKISDYLTWLAEAILEQVMQLSWVQLVAKHGLPMKTTEQACSLDFIIVAYGKLGGLELSYESDLDLVFVHDASPLLATQGPKSLDNQVFFTRLGQKIIHYLSTLTPSGKLYEVDMRLRPSGNSGLLVTSLNAFAEYQRQNAWTWEHQALCRARVVAGDRQTAQRFHDVRLQVLAQPRDQERLREEVTAMRLKMLQHHGSKATGKSGFHLKYDPGGLIDIEFMVQFSLLAHCQHQPDLGQWSDNMRTLDQLVALAIWPAESAKDLQQCYLQLREQVHSNSLAKHSRLIDDPDLRQRLEEQARVVLRWWQHWMQGNGL